MQRGRVGARLNSIIMPSSPSQDDARGRGMGQIMVNVLQNGKSTSWKMCHKAAGSAQRMFSCA